VLCVSAVKKKHEKYVTIFRIEALSKGKDEMKQGLTRELMGMRVAREMRDGMYVNLGIGLPCLVPEFIPDGIEVVLQAENGVLGYGRYADEDEGDPDLLNAGGQLVILNKGACFVDTVWAFSMVRGGHIDLSVLGGYQVSEKGDLANWARGETKIRTPGGALDSCCGVKQVFVIMEHTDKEGNPRILKKCSYPLTGRGVVDKVFTNLSVIEVTPGGMVLKEVAPEVTPAQVQEVTEPKLIPAADLKEMEL